MSSAVNIIRNISSELSRGNRVTELLRLLPLSSLSVDRVRSIFVMFLRASRDAETTRSLVYDLESSTRCSTVSLFSSPEVPDDLLLKAVSSQREKDRAMFYVDALNEDLPLSSLERMWSLLPLKETDWDGMNFVLEDVEDSPSVSFLREKMEIRRPPWMVDLPKSEYTLPSLPSREEALEIMCRDEKVASSSLRERELLAGHYSISTFSEKAALLGLPSESSDEEYFREVGPINTVGNRHCSIFRCLCREESEDIFIEEDVTEWYFGRCQTCDKKITEREYSLRKPLLEGGWRGCYCSFPCVPCEDAREALLVGRMKEQIERMGIRDRTSS